jgi:protein subunit release factor B
VTQERDCLRCQNVRHRGQNLLSLSLSIEREIEREIERSFERERERERGGKTHTQRAKKAFEFISSPHNTRAPKNAIQKKKGETRYESLAHTTVTRTTRTRARGLDLK